MKNAILVTMFTVLVLASSAFALQMPGEIESRGEVIEVSLDASTLKLEETPDPAERHAPGTVHAGVVREFVVDASTKLSASGEAIELADVHPGAQATIVYVMDSGKNIAKSIELRTPTTEY